MIFRIIFESREHYRVMDESQRVSPAQIAGKLREQSLPAVGDFAEGAPQPGGWVLLTQLLPRQSVLQRRNQILAANVDVIFIVTSANQDLNLNRLDRYVILAGTDGIRPVIVINKIELSQDPHALLDQVSARFPSVDVLGVSAHEGWNIDALEDYAPAGATITLIGSSGVGKSTICNALLGGEDIATHAIRDEDGRGRHTTTHRQLHVTPAGAFLIDSPGIRTVDLDADADLSAAFGDIEELARRCKFGDCAHDREPGCAIHAGLDDGSLDPERWANFLKLGRELAHEQRKSNKEAQSAQKRKWAKINADARARAKMKGR